MTAPRTRRLTTDRLVLRQPTEDDLPGYAIVTNGEDSEREHKDAVPHWRHGVTRSGHPAALLYRAWPK